MTNTIQKPGSDASVIRVKGTSKAIAMSLDCNSRYCHLDPYTGGMQAVAEATRNVACSGAKPLAITDCLNFGSPEREDVMWAFANVIDGMSEACRALNTPVVSGNVSFYNQTNEQSIWPTPTIGAVGLLKDHTKLVNQFFKREGDVIILVGETLPEIGGSEYLAVIHGIEKGLPPRVDLEKEAALQKLLCKLADERFVSSMHDISDGGLAVCLSECCFRQDAEKTLGFEVSINTELRPDIALFSETQSRVVLSCPPGMKENALNAAASLNLTAEAIGKITDEKIKIDVNGTRLVETETDELMKPWAEALPSMMSV